MAITIVGVTSNPADNGSLTNTAAIDKDAGRLRVRRPATKPSHVVDLLEKYGAAQSIR